MKKYLILIPVILYPYAYMIWLFLGILGIIGESITGIGFNYLLDFETSVTFYHILVVVIAVYSAITMAINTTNSKQASFLNALVKCVQIPAYTINFVLGVIGFFMGIWGFPLVLFVLFVDVVTIALTGVVNIGCTIKLKREGALSTSQTILYIICSFVFCLDVIFAILEYIKAREHYKEEMLYLQD